MSELKISVVDAAKLMGVSAQYVRVGLQRGIFPWGYAIQVNSKRWTYFIVRAKFMEDMGINDEQ